MKDNAAFGPVKGVRDAIQASGFAMSQPGIQSAKVRRDIPGAMSGIVGRSPTWAKLYDEFLEDGAATGAYGLQTIRDLSSLFEAEGIGLGSTTTPTTAQQASAFARRAKAKRSEERRGGEELFSTRRSRGTAHHKKKNKKK